MKNFTKQFGIIALVMVIGICFLACSRKADAQEGSSSGASTSNESSVSPAVSVPAIVEAPATDFQYDLTADGKGIVIRKYMGNGGKVVIPATIEDFPVVEIGASAFSGRTNTDRNRATYNNANLVTEVVLPDSVKVIGNAAFWLMDRLTTVVLPASLERIENRAFRYCQDLITVDIPDSLNRINFSLSNYNEIMHFQGCGKLPIRTRQRLQELGYTGPF